MSLFDRIFQGEDPPARDAAPPRPGGPPPASLLAPGEGWPEDRQARYGHLFATPGDAVEELARLGARLAEARDPDRAGGRAREVFGEAAREDLEAYAMASQALSLGPERVGGYRAVYLRLAEVLGGQLRDLPEVTSFKLVGSYLRTLGEDLRDGPDQELAHAGRKLLERLHEARAQRKAPAVPAGEAPRGGSTASLADQFRAAYEPEAAAPVEEEDEAPPGDMTAEGIFRILLEECIKDGRFSRAETRAIGQIRELLGIPLRRHSALLKEVEAAHKAGAIPGEAEEMDPLTFFERCYRSAVADHQLTDAEKALLRRLGKYLHVTSAEFAEIRERVLAELRAPPAPSA